MKRILYIQSMSTCPFCHFGREMKYFKINRLLGASFARHSCNLSVWVIHGIFKFTVFITNSSSVAWCHQDKKQHWAYRQFASENGFRAPLSPSLDDWSWAGGGGPHKCRMGARGIWFGNVGSDSPHPKRYHSVSQRFALPFSVWRSGRKVKKMTYFYLSGILS